MSKAATLATSQPVTIYALVTRTSWGGRQSIDAAYVVEPSDHGPVLLNDEDGEYTYADCEYGNLQGLLTFEGAIYTKLPAYDELGEEARESFRDHMGFDFDEYEEITVGDWRRMTVEEAVSLGLLDSIPPITEPRDD